jgi:hypothetical protein
MRRGPTLGFHTTTRNTESCCISTPHQTSRLAGRRCRAATFPALCRRQFYFNRSRHGLEAAPLLNFKEPKLAWKRVVRGHPDSGVGGITADYRITRMKTQPPTPSAEFHWQCSGTQSPFLQKPIVQSRRDCITQPGVGPTHRGPTLGIHTTTRNTESCCTSTPAKSHAW